MRFHFANTDWSDKFVIAHHAHFDLAIMNWHYGVRPRMIGCTLSMGRQLIGTHVSVSLESVRKHFGIPPKVTPYNLFIGKQWSEMDAHTRMLVAEGAVDEVESIWKIFCAFAQSFPVEEYDVVDSTVRWFTEPCLTADVELLRKIWVSEAERRQRALQELGITEADVQSAETFASLLRARGVEPATKEGKNGPIYAFAKTDPFMEELAEDEDDEIRTLAEARLGAKSTGTQTRCETLGWMASRGPLCVYLNYNGAHTSRWSGGDRCLTGDTIIQVMDKQKGLTEKRIVDVLDSDRVWDGEEFVEHGGVVFSGIHEIIEHDGIRGTAEHIVFTHDGKEISLSEAHARGTPLMVARKPNSRDVDND